MSFRQSIKICLFLSFVVIVLIQENTCESDSSSRDDPKSVDAVSSYDVKFFLNEDDSGHVKGLLKPKDHFEKEYPDIKYDSGNAPKGVYNLSSTHLEELSCKPGQTAMFLLHPWKKQTYVGCFRDKKIRDHCPEFNAPGVQPKYGAPCKITFTLCNATYQASEGYKFRKCFEIYGGISSPNERETCTCKTPARTALLESEKSPTPCPKPSIEDPYVIGLIYLNVFLVFIVILFCCKWCNWCSERPKRI